MTDAKMDLDPQVMMIRAIDKISAGWVQGRLSGPRSHAHGPEQDPSGVCLMGAIQHAVDETIFEEYKRLVPQPEGVSEHDYDFQLREAVRQTSAPISATLIKHLGTCLPGGNVIGYNDDKTRSKEDTTPGVSHADAVRPKTLDRVQP